MLDFPTLRDGVLTYSDQAQTRTVVVGTPAWERWLSHATCFTVEHKLLHFTVRKEWPGNGRGEGYWRAYHRCQGTLYRRYIGKSQGLTLAHLHSVASFLAQQCRCILPQQGALASSEKRREPQPPAGASQQLDTSLTAPRKKRPTLRPRPSVLLTTKLSQPPIDTRVILRQRLHERLQQVTRYKLLLISAPAGSGKTTLLTTWAATTPTCSSLHPDVARQPGSSLPIAWLSLDANDNEMTTFWMYCIAALDSLQPGICDTCLALLASSQPVTIQVLLSTLINSLNAFPRDFVLVLDDYHLIEAQAIHEAISFLLDHMPAHMHLVISTRTTPALPLVRLRAHNHILELGAADLRFNHTETTQFLQQTMGRVLPSESIAALETQTEGWIAGLQLASLAFKNQEDVPGLLASFTGGHYHVFEYLVEEVFARQPPPIQTFLLRTSLLHRLNASLCAAVTEQADGQEMLEKLEKLNLFLVPLDRQRAWYRYHHLFAQALHHLARRIIPEQLPVLHQQASLWYEQHGLMQEAIEHALAANSAERAAMLIERMADAALWSYAEIATFRHWFALLPGHLLRSSPKLCILHSWVLQSSLWFGSADARTTHEVLQRAEACLQEAQQYLRSHQEHGDTQTMRAEIAALFATLFFLKGALAQVKASASLALSGLPEEQITLRCISARMLFNLYSFYGDSTMLHPAMQELNLIAQNPSDVLMSINALYNIATFHTMQGNLRQAASTHRRALLQVEHQLKMVDFAAPHSIALGSILLEWNDLTEAERYLVQGIKGLKQRADPGVQAESYFALASLLLAKGDIDKALETLEEGEAFVHRTQQFSLLSYHVFVGYRAWFLFLQGDSFALRQWVETHKLADDEGITPVRKRELTLLARTTLASKKVDAALRHITRLLRVAEKTHHIDWVIQLSILKALALSARGSQLRAIDTLIHTLSLAEPGGYIRTFVNEGAVMKALLMSVQEELQPGGRYAAYHIAPDYLQSILKAFDTGFFATAPASVVQEEQTNVPERGWSRSITLSQREREIVHFMEEGLSDREIAHKMVLAESTIKTYAGRIYTKLGAKNRMQAVKQARALHLL